MENTVESPFYVPQEMDSDIGILQYISGISNGQDYWAYMVMRPSRYMEYYSLIQEGRQIELKDFGQILEEGIGREPPKEISDRITKDFAHDPEFIAQMAILDDKILHELNKEETNASY